MGLSFSRHSYEEVVWHQDVAYARHMGFVPVPCLPGRPEHKGKVERGIGYTQENALKGLRFDSLEEQNAHLKSLRPRCSKRTT